ncbi:DNA internalization-related competence protein ComEC/Rec2 [Gemmatimonas phototrophica]|uniref:Metallo-beta-lactamase domain-containing protein n=1 Tax=Gemmatimonas phototrophica TaxID=1379270 RepID=A0A143BJS7_9BACT|nr:DNA internalization-related competence protein ComEC/Rec2 [Gemmatimonas phototrophica]AMW04772.1 hypothetical protein GEMMAAP_07870 [Gemmatimonas phototrophica]
MPLLIHAVAWWLAGLFVAEWRHTPAPWLLLAGALAVVVRARRVEPLLAIAGMVVATSAQVELTRCQGLLHASLQRGDTVWIALAETHPSRGRRAAQGRGVVHERVHAPRCRVPATVQWSPLDSQPLPAAGSTAGIAAMSLRTNGALRLSMARTTRATGVRNPWRAWQARLGRTIDEAFRQRAPLVRALLIADQRGIAPELRDLYADAGLVHLLSVSGMHVAIIAGALLTLGGVLRLPRAAVEPAAMLLVGGYVLLLGCPAPAVRSAVMLGVMSLTARLQRPVHEWTALALGAVIPTLDPRVVHDLGWQLSVSGMAALVAARALKRRWRHQARQGPLSQPSLTGRLTNGWRWALARQGIGGWMVSEVLTGVIATLVTVPVIAWTFGRISLIAPLSNLAAGPVVGVMQPALFLALLWAQLAPPALAKWLPDATQPLMALLDLIASYSAAVPGAVMPVAPTLWTAVGAGGAAALVVRGTADRRSTPWYVAAAGLLAVTLWGPVVARGSGQLELHVLDVGQGDAVALRTPKGRWVLVDAGPRWNGGDAGRRTVVPYVRRLGGEVALFVMTHPHDDHVGGAASVVRALEVPRWWEPAFVAASPGYRAALQALQQQRSAWERVRPGAEFTLDGVTLTVLAPDSAWTAAQSDANESSVVLRVAYGRHSFLLTGDAEREEEAWMLAHVDHALLQADVLKVGHHGSRTSSSAPFLAVVAPRLAIASLGAGNRYGHPATETVAALLQQGVPLLRTDHEGTVVVRSNGERLAVQAGADHWIIPPAARVW